MNTRTTTRRPRHALPSTRPSPPARRRRPHMPFLEFGILGFGIFLGFGILGFGISGALPAQPAPVSTGTLATTTVTPITTGTGADSPTDDEVVLLSVFNVAAEKDQGYSAMNTTGGSRVATALRDTAANIQPFTEEFLNDIGATTIDDIMAYATNVETDAGDTATDISSDTTRGAGNNNNLFRLRGLGMTTVLDFVPIAIPVDRYNTDRVEIAYGPNSILFGIGAPGGIATLNSTRANLQRNTLQIRNTLGTWTAPTATGIPYYRATLNYNIVLTPRKAALRLMAIYQDGDNQDSWRKYMTQKDYRLNPVLALRPFPNTRIDIAYENGRRKNSTSYAWNASDGISQWLPFAATDPNHGIMQGFGENFLVPGTAVINQNTHLTLNENNSTLYDYRRAAYTVGVQGKLNTPPNVRLPFDMSPFYYNPGGPGAQRDQKFDRFQLVLEQRLGDLNLQFGYYHNQNNATAHAPGSNDSSLRADPNPRISTLEYNTTSPSAGTIPNDYAGRWYMEDYWQLATQKQTYNAYRATAEYTLNLKQFGRHRIIANLERLENEQYKDLKREILVDESQQAIYDASNPTNAGTNNIYRRHYVDIGNFSTYYAGDWRTPISPTPFYANGHYYHATYASFRASLNHTKTAINSAGIVLQSYLLKDKLVTTLGLRVDDFSFKKEKTHLLTDPADPRILNKTKVLNEATFSGNWDRTVRLTPYTYTAGAVYHITDWLTPFINYATNRGSPPTDGRYILPEGNLPPLTIGRTIDYGIRLDLLRDGKLTLRIEHFDTKMLHDAAVSNPNGGAVNSAVGADNLANIFDALYFLSVTNATSLPPNNQPDGPWPIVTLPPSLGGTQPTGPGKGPMPPTTYAVTPVDPAASRPFGAPPLYTTGMIDQKVAGWEINLNANLTKNLTLQAGFSYSQRDRTSVFNEILDYYNANIPTWLSMASPTLSADGKPAGTRGTQPNPAYKRNDNSPDGLYYINVPNIGNGNKTQQFPLWDYLRNQLYGTPLTTIDGSTTYTGGAVGNSNVNALGNTGGGDGSVRGNMASVLYNYGNVVGNRPYQFNMTARYKFPNKTGPLKGLALGAGVRYKSNVNIPDPADNRPPLGTAAIDETTLMLDPADYIGTKDTIKGPSLLFYDAFATYKARLFGGRTTMTLQLNIDNIFNNDVVTTSRVNSYGVIRTYLNPPRRYRLTVTFDF